MRISFFSLAFAAAFAMAADNGLPSKFDLRSVDGKNYVSSVRSQTAGTCWAFAVMAALEGNIMLNKKNDPAERRGDPNLAEYHLDWWNGFNQHYNPDTPGQKAGLTVHSGGDYRVAAAYLTARGALSEAQGQSFPIPPPHTGADFGYFLPREIIWLSAGESLEKIEELKHSLMKFGPLGTALACNGEFFSNERNSFYQPASDAKEPNHAVTIVGWDDNYVTQAPLPGAWLIKNSWGSIWRGDGYAWISYYDKAAGKHPEMGAVSFRDVVTSPFGKVYSHDTHGWRDTKAVKEAFNSFTAEGAGEKKEVLRAIGIYTTAPKTNYDVRVFSKFDGAKLGGELSHIGGHAESIGFHLVTLEKPVTLTKGMSFHVHLSVSQGGQAFDRTSEVPVLLGAKYRVVVPSSGKAGESFYLSPTGWVDLHAENETANFSLKAYTSAE